MAGLFTHDGEKVSLRVSDDSFGGLWLTVDTSSRRMDIRLDREAYTRLLIKLCANYMVGLSPEDSYDGS